MQTSLSPHNKSGQKGQILLLFIALLIISLGFIAVALNTAKMVEEKIKIQTAADAAALAGARIQGLNHGLVTICNDLILVFIAKLFSDLFTPLAAILVPLDFKSIVVFRLIQDLCVNLTPLQIQYAAKQVGKINGASLSVATMEDDMERDILSILRGIPIIGDLIALIAKKLLKKLDHAQASKNEFYYAKTQSCLRLEIYRPWWTVFTQYFSSNYKISEKVTVVSTNVDFIEADNKTVFKDLPKLFFSDLFFGGKQEYPVFAFGSAKPYYTLGHNPRDVYFGGGAGALTAWYFSSNFPGPWWGQRLVETGIMEIFTPDIKPEDLGNAAKKLLGDNNIISTEAIIESVIAMLLALLAIAAI